MKIVDETGREVYLTREYKPLENGLAAWTFHPLPDSMEEAKRVVPAKVPEGYVFAARWTGRNTFDFGLVALKPKEGDKPLPTWSITCQSEGPQGDQSQADRVCPRKLHEGMCLTAKWSGPKGFVVQAAKVAGYKEPEIAKDQMPLEGLEDADLQTLCGENGVKYSAKLFDRFKAITELREKLAEKNKPQAPKAA